jgi:hypothetical protein
MRRLFILAAVVLGISSGCNKTQTFSNRLEGEVWSISKLIVDGVEEEHDDHLAELIFSDCDIYEEVCTGEWEIEQSHAEFAWQFDEKGALLYIANQSEDGDQHEHDHNEEDGEEHMVDAIQQCQDLSGTYDVVDMTRKTIKLKSNNTIGFDGKLVEMEWEKID